MKKIDLLFIGVRTTRGGYVFTDVCLFRWGYTPIRSQFQAEGVGGYPRNSSWGSTHIHPDRGYSHPSQRPGLDGGYPPLGVDGTWTAYAVGATPLVQ